jgi:arylsulfatase A-like enzyme
MCDDSIGQLLKALADSGQADNTIIIFSADNGSVKSRVRPAIQKNHDNSPLARA